MSAEKSVTDSISADWTSMAREFLYSSAELALSGNETFLWYDNETFQHYNFTLDEIRRRLATPAPPPACKMNLTPRHIVLIVCFAIIFTLSVIGNCLVIVTIAQNRWMRTVTNIFLQSLAISDLLLSVICMPPTLTAILFQCFLWGNAMCKLISFLQRKPVFMGLLQDSNYKVHFAFLAVSVAASAYTLVAIALERYNAICRPLHSRHWKTKSHAVKVIVAVWVISFVCSSPALFIYNLVEINQGKLHFLTFASRI